MSELKPCPFCGERNPIFDIGDARILCHRCGATGPVKSLLDADGEREWDTRKLSWVKNGDPEPWRWDSEMLLLVATDRGRMLTARWSYGGFDKNDLADDEHITHWMGEPLELPEDA